VARMRGKNALLNAGLGITFLGTVVLGVWALHSPTQLYTPEPVFNFGRVVGGTELRHAFIVQNPYPWPVTIAAADAPCGCMSVFIEHQRPPVRLLPFQKAKIAVVLNTEHSLGETRKDVFVWTGDARHHVVVGLEANVSKRQTGGLKTDCAR